MKSAKQRCVSVQNDQNGNNIIPNPSKSTSSSSSEAGASAAAASGTAATTGATAAGACFNLVFVARLSTFRQNDKTHKNYSVNFIEHRPKLDYYSNFDFRASTKNRNFSYQISKFFIHHNYRYRLVWMLRMR